MDPAYSRKRASSPAPEAIDLPLSNYARQFYKTGAPFLQRNLPFWLAVLVQQALVLLLPVVGLLYPLLRVTPGLFYVDLQSRRVYGLYSELRVLERELASEGSAEHHKDFIERLDKLEDRASDLWVPPSLRSHLYDLRLHIRLVREEAEK